MSIAIVMLVSVTSQDSGRRAGHSRSRSGHVHGPACVVRRGHDRGRSSAQGVEGDGVVGIRVGVVVGGLIRAVVVVVVIGDVGETDGVTSDHIVWRGDGDGMVAGDKGDRRGERDRRRRKKQKNKKICSLYVAWCIAMEMKLS